MALHRGRPTWVVIIAVLIVVALVAAIVLSSIQSISSGGDTDSSAWTTRTPSSSPLT